MRIGVHRSEGELAQGFDSENDFLGRRPLADQLSNLFQNLEHGTVSLLDGRWGVGKTTFVKQWSAELRKIGIPSIYFDAFSSDYIESPFQAVAGTFVTAARNAQKLDEPQYKRFLDAAARVGKAVGAAGARIGVKAATLGLVGASELKALENIGETLADGAGDLAEEAVKQLIESHSRTEADFHALREALASLPSLLKPANAEQENPPLIVIIDELDRCRPDFALGLLETLKHFFRTDGIHFFVVTNRSHLELAVSHRYGISDSAREYLEKFYDFVVFFEQSSGTNDPKNIGAFARSICEKLLPSTKETNDITNYIAVISEGLDLSLRQVERYVTHVCLSYLAFNERKLRPTIVIAFLAAIKTIDPSLYRKAKLRTINYSDMEKFLNSGDWEENNFKIDRILTVFRYYLDPDIDERSDEWSGYGSTVWQYNIDRLSIIPYVANSVLDNFSPS